MWPARSRVGAERPDMKCRRWSGYGLRRGSDKSCARVASQRFVRLCPKTPHGGEILGPAVRDGSDWIQRCSLSSPVPPKSNRGSPLAGSRQVLGCPPRWTGGRLFKMTGFCGCLRRCLIKWSITAKDIPQGLNRLRKKAKMGRISHEHPPWLKPRLYFVARTARLFSRALLQSHL